MRVFRVSFAAGRYVNLEHDIGAGSNRLLKLKPATRDNSGLVIAVTRDSNSEDQNLRLAS